ASSTSRSRTRAVVVLDTSTTGEAPETVIVSSRAPTPSSALSVAVNSDGSTRPSRLNVLKPGSVNVTEYVPGRRSAMRYEPSLSVTADLTFSIKTSLEASMVTPGIAAPDVSLTTRTIELWAYAALDRRIALEHATSVLVILRAMLTKERKMAAAVSSRSDNRTPGFRAAGGYASCPDVAIQRAETK